MTLLRSIFLLAALPTTLAAEPKLAFPLDCTLGEDCFIQQFVDRDPGPEAADFMCSGLSYDGHRGTDFALPSLASLADGVDVLAAASGVVRGIRDEMPDIMMGEDGAPELNGKDCGNGVLIDHGDGWETQYCHLALGSVAVAAGDVVLAGTVLGRVGLSGRTEFPHLHLSLRQNGVVVDPFERNGDPDCGAEPGQSFWETPLPTPSGGIITIGFADKIPTYDDVKAGNAGLIQLDADGPALVLWAYMFGSQIGDDVKMTILDGNGASVYSEVFRLERGQAQLFRAGGRRTPSQGWSEETHTGIVELVRDGVSLERQTVAVEILRP